MTKKNISEYINVAPRFLRSVNLSNDWRNADSYKGYIITPNITHSLDRLSNALASNDGQKSFTLIGPYGTGKSAFVVYLCQLLLHDDKTALMASEHLSKSNLQLSKKIEILRGSKEKNRGYLPIAVTARRRPIAQLILEGLAEATSQLSCNSTIQNLTNRIQIALEQDFWKDTSTIIGFLQEIGNEAKEQGYFGILLIIDEAGKSLEYALYDRDGGDIYIFQEISEFANRQSNFSMLFIITLHQMFDDYVELAERTVRAEWTKVQERFQSIQFAESAATTIQMLADAIQCNKQLPHEINEAIDESLHLLEKSSTPLPIGLNFITFREIAKNSWPLHPTVLLALPHLFRRLAQNERSIFSYLTSEEPYGFQEHIKKDLTTNKGFVRLHDIYSYLLSNFEAGLARLPHAKRLLEANDVVNSRHNLLEQEYKLIRSIAILNVLGEMCPLRATAKLLECSMNNEGDTNIILQKLKQNSIITYRQLDNSYRVWEGSDVDIDARMKEARRHLHMEGHSLIETLHKNLPQKTLVARRHSLETGAHRYFTISYADRIEKIDYYQNFQFDKGSSGMILIVIPQTDTTSLQSNIEQITRIQPRLIVAIPRQIEALRSVVEEKVCLSWVESNTEELRDDRVARRELSLRLAEAEQKIFQLLQMLIDPRPAPIGNSCQWFWSGVDQKIKSPVEVTKLVSTACDIIYTDTPRLRNELIARTKISSAASGARRILLEKILTNADKECLDINGFPPERSIYESVLRATDIHTFDDNASVWKFQIPPIDNKANLYPCWKLLEQKIFTENVKKVEVQSLFADLASIPYGLPDGIHPILFVVFYVLNQDDLFLYREKTFIPDPQLAHFELLQRRPDIFSVSGARLDGIRRSVVERLSKGLKTKPKTASVVRSLFRAINNLPQITLKSSKFSNKTIIDMRDKFLQARSPEELLFIDLPTCFNLQPFLYNETREHDIELFFENLNICLSALQNHAQEVKTITRNILLKKCSLPENDEGWVEFERRSLWMAPRMNHEILTPFFNSIINGANDNHNPMPALSCVANRSFEQWSDIDFERFAGLADGIVDLFINAWENFGDRKPVLSAIEIQQKNELSNFLQLQIKSIRDKSSKAALCTALKEIIRDIENE